MKNSSKISGRMQTVERPLSTRPNSDRVPLARRKACMTGYGNHRGVIGTKLEPRIVHANTLLRGGGVESRSQRTIRAHTARHHEGIESGVGDGPQTFGDERIDDGILQRECDIRAILIARVGQRANGVKHGGLQSRETELESRPIEHGPRKHMT
jgi:hypothetical protein